MVPLHDEPARPIDRAAYRCRVVGARSTGWLQVGDQHFEVSVLDESSRGFAVELVYEQPIEWQIGQTLFLTRDDEKLEVRLANVSSETIAATEVDEPPIIRTRLGVMRLAEVRARRVRRRESFYALQVLQRFCDTLVSLMTPPRGMYVAISSSFTIAAVLVWTLEHAKPPQQRPEDDTTRHANTQHQAQEPRPNPKPYKPTDHDTRLQLRWPKWLESIANGNAVKELQAAHRRALKEMGRLLRPGLLVEPEVAQLLDLDDDQVKELLRIQREALAMGEEGSGATRAAEDHPGAAWRQQALSVLRPPQRNKLQAYLSERGNAPDLGPANSTAQPDGAE